MAAKFRNTGQSCICPNRIFIQNSIYEVFTEKLIEAIKKLKLSPLINAAGLKKVQDLVADAVEKGAKILYGGESPGGLYFDATVLENVNSSMRLWNEEIFGPVAPLVRFDSEEEVIRMANDTQYGLGSYFYSRDIHRIFRFAEKLECGMVGINEGLISNEVAPFGGYKESGLGREGSKYGIEEFLEVKYLCFGK